MLPEAPFLLLLLQIVVVCCACVSRLCDCFLSKSCSGEKGLLTSRLSWQICLELSALATVRTGGFCRHCLGHVPSLKGQYRAGALLRGLARLMTFERWSQRRIVLEEFGLRRRGSIQIVWKEIGPHGTSSRSLSSESRISRSLDPGSLDPGSLRPGSRVSDS